MTGTLQLEIPVLLPDVPDERDGCAGRLVEELEGRESVEEAHVVEGHEALDEAEGRLAPLVFVAGFALFALLSAYLG